MRKVRVTFTVLFVLGLLLAACGGTSAANTRRAAHRCADRHPPQKHPPAAPTQPRRPQKRPPLPAGRRRPPRPPQKRPPPLPRRLSPPRRQPIGLCRSNVPRDQVLVVDQIFRYSVVDNFNFFVPGPPSPTQQGLLYDTLWYLDQETGEWINSLATDKPMYNADATEMTVKLRPGLCGATAWSSAPTTWSYTVNTLKENPGLTWSAEMKLYVKDVKKTDNNTVVFTLNEPNIRFHTYFTARYNAVYMMAKHVWEKGGDPKTFKNYPPVSLGAYTVRPDSRTERLLDAVQAPRRLAEDHRGRDRQQARPAYILSVFYGDSAKKAIAHRATTWIFCSTPISRRSRPSRAARPTVRSWFKDFPWAYPNELDFRWFGFNQAIAPYDNKDVRWALTLALDIVDLQTNYIGGVTHVTPPPIPVPATALLMKLYQRAAGALAQSS